MRGRVGWSKISPLIIVGGLIVSGWLMVALLADIVAPHDPFRSLQPLALPGTKGESGDVFWLGTDLLGRDILSRLIHGTRTLVSLAVTGTLAAYVLGVGAGLVAGYYRGPVDALLSFLANLMLSFPALVLLLLVIVVMGSSTTTVMLAIIIGGTPVVFRMMRALTIEIGGRNFVAVAVGQGESTLRILVAEILPNASGPLAADLCLRVGYSAIVIGALGFLGMGPPPPTPDWGGMINEGRAMATVYPHLILPPCIALSSLMLGLNFVADGLRSASGSWRFSA
jgi:ABC-type dipeptide/oligopeptide/nickel transport system permease subunit